jgi:hypothetical protein
MAPVPKDGKTKARRNDGSNSPTKANNSPTRAKQRPDGGKQRGRKRGLIREDAVQVRRKMGSGIDTEFEGQSIPGSGSAAAE